MKEQIELGDKVRDIYTGFVGIAVAKTEFINGCVQISVAPKWNGKGDPLMQELGIDQGSLEVIKKKKVEREVENSGGPMTRIIRRNY